MERISIALQTRNSMIDEKLLPSSNLDLEVLAVSCFQFVKKFLAS
jgi:hypothetical protein